MFNLQNQKKITNLNVNAHIYNHEKFGCQHLHLESENNEKVFMVAFRTVPEDSTGVAHILEHTALCGSKKYPVRDPFFMMIRRSINSFMNAFTSSDWTAYPFATQNEKDFNNLLSVYLDSAFFPNLDALDFAQEGHRLEFANEDKDKLEIKGVVYNEMKGAMSSITSQLWHGMSKYLYSSSTYKHNSGGNPEDILDLTHDDLVNFHKKHYHPSNAIFLTFGDMNPEHIQNYIEENVLSKFDPSDMEISVENESRIQSPIRASDKYNPLPGDEKNHHVLISWLLGESHNPTELLENYLMSSVLLDNSASPLRKILETSQLGKSPSPLTGLETSQKEIIFACGFEGVSSNHEIDVENTIIDELKKIVENGISMDVIEASLHQLEIRQKEIAGGEPFGLQLMLHCLPAFIHRDDPIKILDLDDSFKVIRERIKEQGYIESLIDRNLISNNHRLTYTLVPEEGLNAKSEEKINKNLKDRLSTLTEIEKNKIVNLAKSLKQRQEQVDDPEILPKVTKDDVSKEIKIKKPALTKENNYFYEIGSNGIFYNTLIYPCMNLSSEELKFASMFANSITEVENGKLSYEEFQKLQSSISGGISAAFTLIPYKDSHSLALKISGKSLEENSSKLNDLIHSTIDKTIMNNENRLKEILNLVASQNDASLVQNGHYLAMNSSASSISEIASTNDVLSGIKFITNTNKLIKDEKAFEDYLEILRSIQSKIVKQPIYQYAATSKDIDSIILQNKAKNIETEILNLSTASNINNAWITGSQVSFCAETFPSVGSNHKDSAALAVLGVILRNGYLHTAIREKGGAYGSGAMNDTVSKCFKFFSYRDPKCSETFAEFKNSIDWVMSGTVSKEQLEEGILGIVSSIDKPLSPNGESAMDFTNMLDGKTDEDRLRFKNNVLSCTLEDIKRVANTYLTQNSSKSVIAGKGFEDEISKLGFSINII